MSSRDVTTQLAATAGSIDTSLHDLKDGPGRARVLAHANVPTQTDPDIEQLAAFLRALGLAARLDVPILVDG